MLTILKNNLPVHSLIIVSNYEVHVVLLIGVKNPELNPKI